MQTLPQTPQSRKTAVSSKARTAFALLLTLPIYLGCAMLPNHPFAAEWEALAKTLFCR